MFTELRVAPAGRARGAMGGALERLAGPHGLDGYVGLIRPTWSTTRILARVTAVARTGGAVTLRLRPNRRWPGFRAGQHTELTVEIDGVRHTRCYSLANSAHGHGDLELTVKAHPAGLVSNHLYAVARPGMVVGLSPARGDFTLPTAPDRLLFLSGGSGITPLLSMLRTLADEDWRGPVTFVHYARTPAEALYDTELARLATRPNVRVVRIFTAAPGRGDLDDRLRAAQLDAVDARWSEADTYVCGPATLMDAARRCYESADAAARLRTEAFTLAEVVAEAGNVTGSLRFRSGAAVVNDGRSVLAQAEAAGLTPASGCRMGICHTCTRRLCAGMVRDATTGALTHGPDVDIRICVNAPVGDAEIDL